MSGDARLELLLPVPNAAPEELPVATRLASLRGRTVGLIHNGWWSLGVTYEVFEKLLLEKHEISQTVTKRRPHEEPLSPEAFDDLAARADAVICGLGN